MGRIADSRSYILHLNSHKYTYLIDYQIYKKYFLKLINLVSDFYNIINAMLILLVVRILSL